MPTQQSFHRRLKQFRHLFAALAVVAAAGIGLGATTSEAQAEVIEIHFTGLNISYNSGNVQSMSGSNLASIDFFFDDNLVGSFSSGDDLVPNVDVDVTIPESGAFAEASGSGVFDLSLLGGSYNLDLDVTNFEGFVGTGTSFLALSGGVDSVFSQNLPYLLAFDDSQPMSFMISSTNISNVVIEDDVLVSFDARATGSIMGEGTMVPEPTAGLLALAGAGLLACRRSRRAIG